jgi:shikimate 5-dehydrogenase
VKVISVARTLYAAKEGAKTKVVNLSKDFMGTNVTTPRKKSFFRVLMRIVSVAR